MANRFLSNITINDEYTFPSTDGTADQIISTDGAGTLSFIDPAALSVGESEQVHIACKNTSGVSISKGDPVYITGTVGSSFIVEIAAADASNAAKMPAVGLVETDLGINAEGYVIVSGVLKNLTTDPLSSGDGTPSSNDTIYVKPGGGLTKTKPTGSGNYIQNVGKVGRVNSSNAGSIAVSTIMRTNDVPNLNTGKVWVGTPTYTAESTVIHLDESNARLGIGTTSPSYKIHAIGSGSVASFGDGTRAFRVFTDSDEVSLLADGSVDMKFYTGGSEKVRIDTSGKVGIGITTPAYPLDVNGEIRTSSRLWISTIDALSISGSDLRMGYTNSNILFRTNSAERMRIDSSGRVGIGELNPDYPLHIKGTVNILKLETTSDGRTQLGGYDSSDNINFLIGSTDSTNAEFWNYKNGYLRFATNSIERVRIDSSGNVGIGTTSPARKLTVSSSGVIADFISSTTSSYIDIEGTTAQLRAGVFGGIVGLANGSGTTAHLAINSSGNVGIGTTSPTAKLHIYNGGSLISGGTGFHVVDHGSSSGGVGLQLKSTGTNAPFVQWYDGTNILAGIRSTSSRDLHLQTNGYNTRIYIGSSGNVGIGTNSPDTITEIAGNNPILTIRDIDTSSTTATAAIRFAESGAGDTLGNYWDIGYSPVNLLNFDYMGSTKMTIDSSGNVGIGTTSIDATGYVNLETAKNIRINTGSAGANPVLYFSHDNFASATSNYITVNRADESMRFNVNDTERMRIDSSGGVNIYGTDSRPLAITSFNTVSAGAGWDLDATSSNGVITMSTGGTERVRIDSSGQVGINVTPSSNTLDVKSIAASSYVILARSSATSNQLGGIYEDSSNNAEFYLKDSAGTSSVALNSSGNSYLNGGNVGIGTLSPSEKLEVNGNIELSTSENAIQWQSGNGIIQAPSNLYIRTSGAGGNLLFQVNNSEKMRIDSSGNVGIGTQNIGALDGRLKISAVAGYSEPSSISLYGNNGNAFGGSNVVRSKIDSISDGTAYGAIMRFYTNDTSNAYQERMRITSGGDISFRDTSNNEAFYWDASAASLGIGTTSPAQSVHIEKDTSSNQTLRIKNTNAGSSAYTNLQVQNNLGTSVELGMQSSTRSATYPANEGWLYASNGVNLGYAGNTKIFAGNTERLRITSSGNVGINETNPSTAKLVIETGPTSGIDLYRSAVNAQFEAFRFRDSSNANTEASIGWNADQLRLNSTNNTVLTTGGTERMRITSGGNVGIGTSSPASKLESYIVTTGAIGARANANTSLSSNGAVDTRSIMIFGKQGVGGYAPAYFGFVTTDGTGESKGDIIFGTRSVTTDSGPIERMRIDSSGNVGIGTASPSAKLDVVGTIECTSLTETSALRFKENIEEDIDTSIIDKLRPVSYDWKETGDKDYGFIAEEVDELDSILTTKEEDGQLIGIKYTKLIPFLVKKIQEQEKRIKQLENGKS